MPRYMMVAVLFLLTASAHSQTNAPGRAVSVGRPTIGLVLGGGGALGIAHIGVLQTLERMRIPVDYIAGTSMGSIIAGLYAAGLSPDDMERVFLTVDWWDLMRDQTPYRDLDFRRKQDSSRYLMDLELGLQGYRIMFPHGFAAGQKFNNLMQELTVNVAGIESFDELNIPFRAVATDLRSGQAVILDHGNLATAMRASMAVPGVFTPVKMAGVLMVDGGLVNNIPVDVVKALGADIVIAVDVGASDERAGQKSSFESLGDILSRTYAIMQRPKDRERRAAADVLIEPNLEGLSASDFHRAANLIPSGAEAAEMQSNVLARLAVDADTYAGWLAQQRRRRAGDMRIRSVIIAGNRMVPTEAISKRVETQPGDNVNADRIRKDVARVHGMGDFQTVTHQLVPTGEPDEYDLKIEALEKYWGPTYLHFGLRFETDLDEATSWSVLINLRRSSLNQLGGELQADLEAGRRQRAYLEWYQPVQKRDFFFVAPSVDFKSETADVFARGEKVAEYKKDSQVGRLDVGMQYKEYGELRGGVQFGRLRASPVVGDTDLAGVEPDLAAFTMRLTIDRLDARVFPRHGLYLRLNGYFSAKDLGADDAYSKLDGNIRWVASRGDHTLNLGLRGGSALGSDIPLYDQYTLGGVPDFPGLRQDELRGPYFGVGGASYRYRVGRLSPSMGQAVYLMAGINIGNVWQTADEIGLDDLVTGTFAGVAFDTVFGPLLIGAADAEGGRKQLYLTVGTVF